MTTSPTGELFIDAYHSVEINAPVNAQGVSPVLIFTNQGGANGDYSIGTNGSLSFTGPPGGQSLNINGDNYTLLYTPSDLLGIDSQPKFQR